jgi:hypothetical protein
MDGSNHVDCQKNIIGPDGQPTRCQLALDWKKYAQFLDDPDLCDESKEKYIRALWSILLLLWGAGYSISNLEESLEERPSNSISDGE